MRRRACTNSIIDGTRVRREDTFAGERGIDFFSSFDSRAKDAREISSTRSRSLEGDLLEAYR